MAKGRVARSAWRLTTSAAGTKEAGVTEVYGWAFWFRELAVKIAEGGEEWLIQKARLGGLGQGTRTTQAWRPGRWTRSRSCTRWLKGTPRTGGRRSIPVSRSVSAWSHPYPISATRTSTSSPLRIPMAAACFHDSSDFSPKLLWKLFRQVVEHEPQVDPTTFREVLEIKFVAPVKLTHTLLSHQSRTTSYPRMRCDTSQRTRGWTQTTVTTTATCVHGQGQAAFRECRAYEINTFLFFQYMSKFPLLTTESQFFQVSTRAYETIAGTISTGVTPCTPMPPEEGSHGRHGTKGQLATTDGLPVSPDGAPDAETSSWSAPGSRDARSVSSTATTTPNPTD